MTWLARDLTQTFNPALQTVLPAVIQEVISCLATDTGDNGEQINAMRTQLRRFIMNEEISG